MSLVVTIILFFQFTKHSSSLVISGFLVILKPDRRFVHKSLIAPLPIIVLFVIINHFLYLSFTHSSLLLSLISSGSSTVGLCSILYSQLQILILTEPTHEISSLISIFKFLNKSGLSQSNVFHSDISPAEIDLFL